MSSEEHPLAEAGDLIDVQTRSEIQSGSVTLDSFLQLYFQGEPVAFNDNWTGTSLESRITYRAQTTGWYTASVQDLEPQSDLDQTYDLLVRKLGAEARRVTINVDSPTGLSSVDFDPTITMFADRRNSELGGPILLASDQDDLELVLEQGDYLLLLHNRVGQAAEYTVTISSVPVN